MSKLGTRKTPGNAKAAGIILFTSPEYRLLYKTMFPSTMSTGKEKEKVLIRSCISITMLVSYCMYKYLTTVL